ncbi:uncharacterized protein LOC123477107 [Daphnia magna]|uniref:uncharacterized protein LOC123477107 n=1 Tax=Daphnia magna TaxID=35525 RepID=UPI001E1BCAD9|nr:uncharacterized protein LOC123477107 [Daphnia magna]
MQEGDRVQFRWLQSTTPSPTPWRFTDQRTRYRKHNSASESSLIQTEMARKLGLEERTNNIKLKSIHGTESDISTTTTSFTIASSDHSVAYTIKNALTIPDNLSTLPLEEIDTSLVTILLGYDILDVHLTLEVRRPSKSAPGPTAIRTSLGWTVVSRFQLNQPTFQENAASSHCTLTRLHEDPLTALVENFSSTESFGTTPDVRKLVSPDDHAALASYARTIRLLDTGRYEIGLPWRIPRQTLPDNSHQILKNFFALERRLLQQPELAKRYSKAINEYAELGYARQVSSDELKIEDLGSRWYVPHHAVTHPHKPNKLRVVFNLSAKHRGISLNAVLLKLPDFYPNLVGVLLRFRSKKIAVSADIAKMFLQVRLREEDQPYLSYWWRPPGDVRPPQTFQMIVQTFSGVSSPSSCLYAVRKTLEDNPEFEDLRSKILRHMFVDNYLDSFDSEDTAIQDCLRLKELLSRGGFQLNQWTSSSRRVLAAIPPEERDKPELDLDLDELPVERMLGNWYDSQTDAFTFKFKPQPEVRSMRQLLSAVASVFDPIGFITPVVLVGKLLFQ